MCEHARGCGVTRPSPVKALALLDSRCRIRSDSWFELARRLHGDCCALGSATHCLYEWAEPDDAKADNDDYRDVGDDALEPAEQGRLRSLRQGRRWLRYSDELDEEGARRMRSAPNGAVITVPAELVANLRVGLHHLLGAAADDIADITSRPGREQHPEWYQDSRTQLEQAWALLDLVGWADPREPTAARIDLRQYRWAATSALKASLMFARRRTGGGRACRRRARRARRARAAATPASAR